MIKKKFIVSGNYDEYLEYIHKKNLNISNSNTEYIYVNSKKDFDGHLDVEGFYIGTYFKRPDIDDIKERIAISKRIKANDIEINQLAERINANKEAEYSVELRNNSVEMYTPAEDSVYGNVTGYKRKHTDPIE
jgi:hypothetical protein